MAKPPQNEPAAEGSFLSRWSQRKRMAAAEIADDTDPQRDAAQTATPEPSHDPQDVDTLTEEELAALPAPETFTPETDIRPFLRKGVPQSMRNAALRKMWLLTPAIRDHNDPAVDYAWDWNTPGGVPGDGAAPSVERAAQMLKDLVTPRHKILQDDDHARAEGSISKADTPDDCAETIGPIPPEPARISSKPVVASADSTESAASSTEDTPMPALRRHGGAIPH